MTREYQVIIRSDNQFTLKDFHKVMIVIPKLFKNNSGTKIKVKKLEER